MFIIIAIREMQNKTTLRFNLILVRMAKIKETMAEKPWKEYGEKGTDIHYR